MSFAGRVRARIGVAIAAVVFAPAAGRAGECPATVDGTCWVTRSIIQVSATATAFGRTVTCGTRCRAPFTEALILGTDGTYRVPGGRALVCPSGAQITVPDEVGTVRPARGRRLFLEPTNRDELLELARDCIDPSATVPEARGFSAWVRPSRAGDRLTGLTTFRGRVPGRIPVNLRVSAHVVGVPAGTEPPVPGGPRLRECGSTIVLRCTL
jgi:hypothetical protein